MNEIKLGWLSPTGEMIECNAYEHISTAYDILEKNYDMGSVFNNPDDKLVNLGWVHICRGAILDHNYHFFWNMNRFLTPEQIQYLKPYFEDESVPIDRLERDMFFDRLELM